MAFMKRNNKNKAETTNNLEQITQPENNTVIPKPQICLIDFKSDVVKSLQKKGFNIRPASLGLPITVPNKNLYDRNLCLLNYDLPSNIHEYDIIALDMDGKKSIPYDAAENFRDYHKSNKSIYILTEFPQTLFDPRPLASQILKSGLSNINNRKYIFILFASKKEDYEYTFVSLENGGYTITDKLNCHNYLYFDHMYFDKNLEGKETEVVAENEKLRTLLNSNNELLYYKVVFYHPTFPVSVEKRIKNINFIPLLVNNNKEIVSYHFLSDKALIFVFPQINAKEKILIPLFEEILPSMFPEIFPYSTLFSWKDEEEYWLPNHMKLNKEKMRLQLEFKEKLNEIDVKIKENITKYTFLHDLITETDEKLVDAVKKYLEWLGFKKVIKMDREDRLKEEDLQVELENGLLIIEVKGIGGTSKDSDCSQISKVKFRRCKERGKFDVNALYIVNHQRYLAPKQRKNPPFTDMQITDAENDERGLLTTWDLFKSYYLITNGIVDKEYIQEKILSNGFIKFIPDNLKLLGKATEVFKKGMVFILKIENINIQVGDSLIILSGDSYERIKIVNLQLNDNNVNEVNSGEIGFLIDKPIKRNTFIYIETAE